MARLNRSVIEKYDAAGNCTTTFVTGGNPPAHLLPLIALRTGATGVPITNLIGRVTIPSNIFVGGLTYDDFTMRRKAEILQYNGNSTKETQKTMFSKMQFRKNMKNVNRSENCPVVVYPPSNSGVTDLISSGYYYNPNIPFRSSI
jgi:hypothetical protein